MSGTIMPSPVFTGFDDDGNIVSNGLLWVYAAGTSTLVDTWFDADLTTEHDNPIQLDGAGRAIVFLDPAQSYKFRLEEEATPPAHGALIWEVDGIQAVPNTAGAIVSLGTAGEDLAAFEACYLSDGSGGKIAGRWYRARGNNAYSSTTPTIGFPSVAILAGAIGSFLTAGDLPVSGPLTIGATYYVDPTTAGAITPTKPVSSGQFARRVGQASGAMMLIVSANPPTADLTFPVSNNVLMNTVFGG